MQIEYAQEIWLIKKCRAPRDEPQTFSVFVNLFFRINLSQELVRCWIKLLASDAVRGIKKMIRINKKELKILTN